MAEDTPTFIPARPDFIPAQKTPDFIPVEKAAAPEQEGLAHKVWSRLWEPVKAEEYEKYAYGIRPEDSLKDYQRFEMERARGQHTGQPNPYEAGSKWAGSLATVDRAGLKTISDFFSPGQWAMRFTGPVGAAAGAGFTTMQAHDLYTNWERMSPADKFAGIAGLTGGTIMTAHGVATTKPTAIKRSTEPALHEKLAYKYNVTPEGEMHGLYMFRDPVTGGSIYLRKTEFEGSRIAAERAMREKVQTHRATIGEPAANEDPMIAARRASSQARNEAWRKEHLDKQKGVNFFKHYFSNPAQAMRESGVSEVEAVGEHISKAEAQKNIWVGAALRQVETAIEGLNSKSVSHVGEILDRWDLPHKALGQPSNRTGEMFSQQEVAAAIHTRIQLLKIWEQLYAASGRTPGSFRLGFIQNYLPHLESLAAGGQNRIIASLRYEASQLPAAKIAALGSSERFEGGTPTNRVVTEPTVTERGRSFSQFLLRRGRRIPDADLEYDIRKLMPRYLRAAGKVLFDRPAVLASEESIKGMPANDTWRQFADAYLDSYTNKSDMTKWARKSRELGRSLATAATRTLLFMNPKLQTLHLGRLALNAFPEMEAPYFKKGLIEVATHPFESYRRALDAGILPQSVPARFLTAREKFDLVGNYLGAADFIDRSVVFEGQRQKYLDAGMPPDQANWRAARDSARISFLSSPANTPLAFKQGSGWRDAVSSMALQYKHIPSSILYQYAKIASNIGNDPAKAAKLVSALTTAVILQHYSGLHLTHLSFNILNIQAAVTSLAKSIATQLQTATKWYMAGNMQRFKHHIKSAAEDTIYLLAPGGGTMRQAERYGPWSIVREPSDEEKKRRDRQWRQEHR